MVEFLALRRGVDGELARVERRIDKLYKLKAILISQAIAAQNAAFARVLPLNAVFQVLIRIIIARSLAIPLYFNIVSFLSLQIYIQCNQSISQYM